jgi:hypothetical protein
LQNAIKPGLETAAAAAGACLSPNANDTQPPGHPCPVNTTSLSYLPHRNGNKTAFDNIPLIGNILSKVYSVWKKIF